MATLQPHRGLLESASLAPGHLYRLDVDMQADIASPVTHTCREREGEEEEKGYKD